MEDTEQSGRNQNVSHGGSFQIGDEGSSSSSIQILLAKYIILKSQLNATAEPTSRLALLEKLAETGKQLKAQQNGSMMKEKAS